MSDKLSSSAVLNLLASVTSEFVNVAIQNVMLKRKQQQKPFGQALISKKATASSKSFA